MNKEDTIKLKRLRRRAALAYSLYANSFFSRGPVDNGMKEAIKSHYRDLTLKYNTLASELAGPGAYYF